MAAMFTLVELLGEYDRALAYTDSLWRDLPEDEVRWRPHTGFSPIGWHLGHQTAVAHFMLRNLLAAEASLDPELEPVMDSANPEPDRGAVPGCDRIASYREAVAERVRARVGDIEAGRVGAPDQLRVVGGNLLVALVNHEYQHDQWIAEVRSRDLGHRLPDRPRSGRLTEIDGYTVLSS